MVPTIPRKKRAICQGEKGMGSKISEYQRTEDMIPSQCESPQQHQNKTKTNSRHGQTPKATSSIVNRSLYKVDHRGERQGRITPVQAVQTCANSVPNTSLSPLPNENDLQRLQRLKNEVESCNVKSTRTSRHEIRYIPTYRAVLAQRGYLVQEKLGKGSYSQVRLAKSFTTHRGNVAVKIVDRQLAPRDFKDKFLPREIRIWPTIQHQNIIRIFGQFSDVRRVFFIMEYAAGGDALHYIQKHGALAETTARSWFRQLTDAVRYLHARRITHRDLKLENILLDSATIKVCDFGFAKNCDDKLSETFCGSKSYASPEILSGIVYDPLKADIWALGVIVFILVTGKMPFDEKKGNTGILQDQKAMTLYWPAHSSASCRTMIINILVYDYRHRPTIADVICYSWLKEERPPHDSNNNKKTSDPISGKYSVLPPVRRPQHRLCAQVKDNNNAQPSNSV